MSENTRRHGVPLWAAAIALVLVAVQLVKFHAASYTVNHDAALYLQIADLLLDGAVPYVDIFEINPPLVWYLHIPFSWLADMTQVPVEMVFNLSVLFLAVLSSAATYACLIRDDNPARSGSAALAALAPLAALLLVGDTSNFGQRELLFMLALWPFLALRTCRFENSPVPRSLSLFIGVALAITVCLKPPQFGAVVVATEIALALAYRNLVPWRAPEILAAVGTACVYVGALLTLPSEAREAFLDRLLPMVVDGYQSYAAEPAQLGQLARKFMLVPLAFIALMSTISWKLPRSPYRTLALLCGLAGIVCGAVFWAQGKGWDYHALPVKFLAVCTVLTTVAASRRFVFQMRAGPASRPVSARLVGATLAIACAAALSIALATDHYRNTATWDMGTASELESFSQPGDPVLYLSADVYSIYPLLLASRREPASRHLFSFTVPMLYAHARQDPNSLTGYRLPETLVGHEDLFLREIAADIQTKQPRLVFIENRSSCKFCPAGFSLLTYFTGQARIAAELGRYERLDDSGIYAVFRRRAALARQSRVKTPQTPQTQTPPQ